MLERGRFDAVWQAVTHQPPRPGLFKELHAALTEPHRYYHTADHVADCLTVLDGVRRMAERPFIVELALWFHDAVYDPRSSDNELQSGNWVHNELNNAGKGSDAIAVQNLILATQHTGATFTGDAALTVDIDLSILGRDRITFDRYDAAIRREYAWVAEADYRAGRMRILQSFLDRPAIYHTATFRDAYEPIARLNLSRAIAALRSNEP